MTSQALGQNDKQAEKMEFATSLPEEIELKNFIGYANRLQAAIKVWKNKAKEAVNNARWLGEEVVRLEERCEAADGEIAYIRSALKEILDSEPVNLKHKRAKQLALATSKRPSPITYSSTREARQIVKPELAQNLAATSSQIAPEMSNEKTGETSQPTVGSDGSGGLTALRQNYRESTPDAQGGRNEQRVAAPQVNGIVRRDPSTRASPEQEKSVHFGPIDPRVKAQEEAVATVVVEGEASSGNQTSRSRTTSRHQNPDVKADMRGRPKQHEVVKRKLETRAEGQSKRRRLATSEDTAEKEEQQQHQQPEEDLLGAFKKSNDDGRSDGFARDQKQEENVTIQSAQSNAQAWTMKMESDVPVNRDEKLSSRPSPPLRGILKVRDRGKSNPPPPLPPSVTKTEGKYGGEVKMRRASLTLQPPPPPLIKPSPPSPSKVNFIGPIIPEDLKKQQSVAIVAQPKLSVAVKATSEASNSGPAQHSSMVQQAQPPMTPNPTEVIMVPQAYPMTTNQYPPANSSPQLQTVYFQLPNQAVPVPGPPLPHQGVPLPPPNHHQGNGMNNDVATQAPGNFNNNVQPNNFNGPPPANFTGGPQGGFSNQPPGPQRPGNGQWINDYPQRVAKIESTFKNRFVCYSFCINGRCSCQFTNPQAHPQELAGRFGPRYDDQAPLPPDVVHSIWTRLPERFKKTVTPGNSQREFKCRMCGVGFLGYFNFNKHLNESGHRSN